MWNEHHHHHYWNNSTESEFNIQSSNLYIIQIFNQTRAKWKLQVELFSQAESENLIL